MINFIQNIGEFFPSNYFNEDFPKQVIDKSGYDREAIKLINKKINALRSVYFEYKKQLIEGHLRTKDRITITHRFHSRLLTALDYPGDQPEYNQLFHLNEKEALPVRHTLYRGDDVQMMVMEMQPMIPIGEGSPDGLFEQQYHVEDKEQGQDKHQPPQVYHRSQWSEVFTVPEGVHISPMIINKAISELFLLDQHRRPDYILLLAGNVVFLLEQEKWMRGQYLEFHLEELFDEATHERNYLSLFYLLCSKKSLAPTAEIVLMQQIEEESHKSAYAVTQDLKEAVVHAVEAIANEALYYLDQQAFDMNTLDAGIMKDECLTMVYRLLFLFYAESRQDLDILPVTDQVYQQGYALEMLRDLEQVPLHSASSQSGYFFHESITQLFRLLSGGYRESELNNRSFRVRHLDSPLFDDERWQYLQRIKIRNYVWQEIIKQLSLSKKQRGKNRGRISYANLGINQLGSVYESLLAFRGYFAETDLIEVHRKRKKKETSQQVAAVDGSYLVPRSRMDDFREDEIFREENDEVRIIPRGTFVYRLSGRDRQKTASYYTPEVLTQCTVKYTLKGILEKVDGGEMQALDLLDLKILEPAMGAAAFHNEVINQLAVAYLTYRQQESQKKVAPDRYQEELQKVKAYIALNNVYGVDINPTAIELGKISLWLNVIHKDMETPFFGYRLGVGNAVVGAWLKVYKEKEVVFEARKKKSWWKKAPKALSFGQKGIKRPKETIYHFLLPDKNMVPSADIRMLRDAHPAAYEAIKTWRSTFFDPISRNELPLLHKICNEIDRLLQEHYQFQRKLNYETNVKPDFFGAHEGESYAMPLRSYSQKEELAKNRTHSQAPYFKLKLIMDYWCSLWFWDMRQAIDLPTRQQWYEDLAHILELDESAPSENKETSWYQEVEKDIQYIDAKTLEHLENGPSITMDTIIQYADDRRLSLFGSARLQTVKQLAEQHRFFHYQLEFIEVFRERGGFDIAVGNPPWIKMQFDEKGIISETYPEVAVRKMRAPQVRKLREQFLQSIATQEAYYREYIQGESIATFMNALQNYPLLKGQQTNLYKCIIENGFQWISENGYLGLLHPEGIYDDPKGKPLRKNIYRRLCFHFQFQNAFNLFAEVAHREKYSTNIYSGVVSEPNFKSINNLYHPSTIDPCFIHDGAGLTGGIKIRDSNDKFVWNLAPHRDRIIHFTEAELRILARAFENSDDWQSAKLVSIHSRQILSVLEKLSNFPGKVADVEHFVSEGWHETNAQNKGIIRRETRYPDVDNYELIYSGPHFFVGNPLYKTPRENCAEKADYDVIDLTRIPGDFVPRTNYVPDEDLDTFRTRIKGLNEDELWIDQYKLVFSKMLSIAGERTLQPAIIPPRVSHSNAAISVLMELGNLLELLGLCSSLIFDFYIKSKGKSNLYDDSIKGLLLGIDELYTAELKPRILKLVCSNIYYASLWETNWTSEYNRSKWSVSDDRLSIFDNSGVEWRVSTPLRNYYERRLALVELDVIVAQALGLSLEELILIYNVQFPVLQQNEDDTWYDQKGDIVFTCSKGLTGVGLDRKEWEHIRKLKKNGIIDCSRFDHMECLAPGEITYTITKSELYYGGQKTYYAPFDRCDRVEDYKVAWAHFERVFAEEKREKS